MDWTIHDDEQGEPVEFTMPTGITWRFDEYFKPEVLALIRTARAARDAEFLAAIEEERMNCACPHTHAMLDRLAARVKEGK